MELQPRRKQSERARVRENKQCCCYVKMRAPLQNQAIKTNEPNIFIIAKRLGIVVAHKNVDVPWR